jgi:hypothetical protein
MRRFECVQPALPHRPGLNPFTKKAITIPARPERRVVCEIGIEGRQVTLRWSWFTEAAPVGEPHTERKTFGNRGDAEVFLEERIVELRSEGYVEHGDGAGIEVALVAEATVVAPPPDIERAETLCLDVIAHFQRRGWFGCDMHWKYGDPPSDAVERKRFRRPRATEAQLEETERLLHFALPTTLRTLYKDVANGGFGPGYGLVGAVGGAPASEFAKDLADDYCRARELSPFWEESGLEKSDPNWFEPFFNEWPPGFVRILEWGCCIWSVLDLRHGRVLRFEPVEGKRDREAMEPEADSLDDWLRRWLRGEDLFRTGEAREATRIGARSRT